MTAVLVAAAMVISAMGGPVAWGYATAYVVIVGAGWPLGWALFGRNHPGAWIVGSLLGYGIAATLFWLLAVAGLWVWWSSLLVVLLMGSAANLLWRRTKAPLIRLPCWRGNTTVALAAVLLLTLAVMSVPYARVGEVDDDGGRRYRAYFTADFVWHEALTAELTKGAAPPKNPYAAHQPLAYYWTYFVVPATVTRVAQRVTDAPPPIDTYLKVNGVLSGTLFMSVVFLACWVAVPRAAAAGLTTGLTMIAASAEGLYAAYRIWTQADSLAPLRDLNVDAVTLWWFDGLTFDGLPRALWYNPQHSMACALGLVAMILASRLHRTASPAAAGCVIGICLGLALLISPFPAGALSLVVAGRLAWELIARPGAWRRTVAVAGVAGLPLAAGLWWCVHSGMVSGAGSNVSVGLSEPAMRNPLAVLGLAAGPLLLPVLAGVVWASARRQITPIAGSALGVSLALLFYFFVTLDAEPNWIGWRAGQVLLVTAPAAIAYLLVRIRRNLPRPVLGVVVLSWLCVGAPTTVIDWYNAQDTGYLEMGPSFRWTVRISPAEQGALAWVRRETPTDAIVQTSTYPRGRETWSLVPSFGHRRMTAGLPISLMSDEQTRARAGRVDEIFQSKDAPDVWLAARHFAIDFFFLGHVEQETFPAFAGVLAARPDLFTQVYANDGVAVFAVLCQVPNTCH